VSPNKSAVSFHSEPARKNWNLLADDVLGVDDLGDDELGGAPKPPTGPAPSGGRKRRPVNPWKDLISDVRNAKSTGAISTMGRSSGGNALGMSVMSALAQRQAGTGKEINPESGGDGKDEMVRYASQHKRSAAPAFVCLFVRVVPDLLFFETL